MAGVRPTRARVLGLRNARHSPLERSLSLLHLSRERAQSPRMPWPPHMSFRVQVLGIIRAEGLLQDYQHRLLAADLSNRNLRFQDLNPHRSNIGFRTWPLTPQPYCSPDFSRSCRKRASLGNPCFTSSKTRSGLNLSEGTLVTGVPRSQETAAP